MQKKSVYEKAWLLPFLIIYTALIIGAIIHMKLKGVDIRSTFYLSLLLPIVLWIGYFKWKKRK